MTPLQPIYLRIDDRLVEMQERPYEAESVLQQLLAEFPLLLAGGTGPSEWVLVTREIAIGDQMGGAGRWSLDHLFLDREGVPTLVEVKRRADTRIRREVVGQLLEYAANATAHWRVSELRATFEARFGDPTLAGAAIADLIGAPSGETDVLVDAYWERVDSNLQAGRLRLVFVADEIPTELQRIVEFLNEQMTRTDVIAIEVRQYVDPDGHHQTLVPRVIGETTRAQQTKSNDSGGSARARAKVSVAEVLASYDEHQSAGVATRARRLFESLQQQNPRLVYGSGGIMVWIGENSDSSRAHPVSVGFWAKTGTVSVNFKDFANRRSLDSLRALADRIATIPGMQPGVDQLALKGHRSWLDLGAALESDEGVERLITILRGDALRGSA